MANAKEVHIEAEGLWPIGQDEYNGYAMDCKKLSATIGRINLDPVIGLKTEVIHHVGEIKPNVHGGVSPIDKLIILGVEGVSWGWLDDLVVTIHNAGLMVKEAVATDIDDAPRTHHDLKGALVKAGYISERTKFRERR